MILYDLYSVNYICESDLLYMYMYNTYTVTKTITQIILWQSFLWSSGSTNKCPWVVSSHVLHGGHNGLHSQTCWQEKIPRPPVKLGWRYSEVVEYVSCRTPRRLPSPDVGKEVSWSKVPWIFDTFESDEGRLYQDGTDMVFLLFL